MNRHKIYKFTPEFQKFIVESTAGYLRSSEIDSLLQSFEEFAGHHFFTRASESNLIRIISSIYDRTSFLCDSIKYRHHPEIILAIAANSNYLTDIIVRSPEYLHLILNPGYLNERVDEKTVIRELSILSNYHLLYSKLNIIRSIKKKLILKIGLRDILGEDDIIETTSQLSLLAKLINNEVFALCYSEILGKYGIKSTARKYCLASLGKLGGNELNYSSDVDLFLFYDKNSRTGKNKEYYEILSEAAQLFIKSSTEVTDRGYIYRIDFRLRPDGASSPICRSAGEYIRYYETRGEDWERQMLIKLDFVGGSKKLFESFKDYIEHYIFPASFTTSPLAQIGKMKYNIEQFKKTEDNIKLQQGGIRDIEFSIQALQLINGGKHAELRTGNSLTAIYRLACLNLITHSEENSLTHAYKLYRRIEHYLQLMNDTQTHTIPSGGELGEKLSVFLGHKDYKEFSSILSKHRSDVRSIYNSIIGAGNNDKPERADEFFGINFSDKIRALNNFKYLRYGTGLLGIKEFDLKTSENFKAVENRFIDYLKKAVMPDLVLDNAVRFIKSSGYPSIWFSFFKDEKVFKSFLIMCEYSSRAVEMCTTDKSLYELFLSGRVFYKLTDEFAGSLTIRQVQFLLAVQNALDLIDQKGLSPVLSSSANRNLYSLSFKYKFSANFFIAALGSSGTNDMTFSSDIDLIFVSEKSADTPAIQNEFQKYFNDAVKLFKPLSVDCRLRPEGKNSPLVWDMKAYSSYLESRARIWEYQALSKIKFIAGDKVLFESFTGQITKTLARFSQKEILSETLAMYRNIQKQNLAMLPLSINLKKSKGTLLDIEFIINANILKSKKYFSDLLGNSTLNRLEYFIKFSPEFEKFIGLNENYAFLKNLECTLQNIFNIDNPLLPVDEVKRKLIAKKMRFNDPRDFEKKLGEVLKSNNRILETLLAKKDEKLD